MRKIAIINQKGGVGKTTTTANLGAALARAGRRVLLLDFDPQGHLTIHFGIRLAEDQANSYDVLTDDVSIVEASLAINDGMALVPTDINLAGAESELVSVTGREVLLKEALLKVEDQYDYLLIDCPPSVGVLTVNALSAADELLIPLQTQFFALQGFGKLLEKTVTLVRRRINPSLTVTGVILCMHEAATRLACEVVEDLRAFLDAGRSLDVAWAKAKIFDAHIRRNIKLAEACSFGQSIFEYAPKSNGAMDYLRLAAEIFPEAGIELPHWMARSTPSGTRNGQASTNAIAASVTKAMATSKKSSKRPVSGRPPGARTEPPADCESTALAQVPRIVRVIDARALVDPLDSPDVDDGSRDAPAGVQAAADHAVVESLPVAPNDSVETVIPPGVESGLAHGGGISPAKPEVIELSPSRELGCPPAPVVRSAVE